MQSLLHIATCPAKNQRLWVVQGENVAVTLVKVTSKLPLEESYKKKISRCRREQKELDACWFTFC